MMFAAKASSAQLMDESLQLSMRLGWKLNTEGKYVKRTAKTTLAESTRTENIWMFECIRALCHSCGWHLCRPSCQSFRALKHYSE